MGDPLHSDEVLRVLVGSQAHGLATPQSDLDYRAVHVVRTSELLKVDSSGRDKSRWSETEAEDTTSYEIGHFLSMALRSSPVALEVFRAPVIASTTTGESLRQLFPHVWSAAQVHSAFLGYAENQRKKLTSPHPGFSGRRWKYGVSLVRILIQGAALIRTNELTVKVPVDWKPVLYAIRDGEYSVGQVIDLAEQLHEDLDLAYEEFPSTHPNLQPVNDYLLQVRSHFW